MSDRISDLIADAQTLVLEAGYESTRWPDALDAMARACGARSGQLISLNRKRKIVSHWLTEVPDGFLEEVEAFGLSNPVVNPRMRGVHAPLLTPVADQDFVDPETRARHPIYAEIFEPHDLFFNCQVVIERSPDMLVRASITRTRKEGPLDMEAFRVFSVLMPHVQSAVQLQSALTHARMGATLWTFDVMATAAFLLDRAGRVLAMSAKAERWAKRGDVLQVVAGRLRPAADQDRKGFDAALGKVLTAARRGTGIAMPPLAICSATRKAAVALTIRPLPPDGIGLGQGAAVLVIAEPQRARSPAPEILKRLYGFTSAEAAVALSLARGQTPEAISGMRDVSIATVRSQIKTIYAKASVRRQAELSALLRKLS